MIKIDEQALARRLAHIKTFEELMIQQIIENEQDMYIEGTTNYRSHVEGIFNEYYKHYFDLIWNTKEEPI